MVSKDTAVKATYRDGVDFFNGKPVSLSGGSFTRIFDSVLAARAGGANVFKGAIRVAFWGSLVMTVTAGIGAIFGTVV